MKIVILDGETINPGDLSWSSLASLGDLTVYDRCSDDEASMRIGDADCVFFSKVNMTRELIESHPNIKFLCVMATGIDNLDLKAAHDSGIACCNIPAYSTDAVAQHAIALMLELSNQVGFHNQSVVDGEWNEDSGFCYWKRPLVLLKGKSLGIVGYGNIGKKVAEIAKALGMNINIYSRDAEKTMTSDFISLHIPATKVTENFINKETIDKMKDGAYLINTARGAVVNEVELAEALKVNKIAGYATDVLKTEPPRKDNPLIGLNNSIITPHNAWCPIETRKVVCDTCAENLQSFLTGEKLNRVDL